MKRILLLLAIAGISSCGNNQNNQSGVITGQWEIVNLIYTEPFPSEPKLLQFRPFVDNNSRLYVYGDYNGVNTILSSTDHGTVWEKLNMPDITTYDNTPVFDLQNPNRIISYKAIGDSVQLYESTNAGITWNNIGGSLQTNLQSSQMIGVFGSYYFVYNKNADNKLYRSSDNGNSWQVVLNISTSRPYLQRVDNRLFLTCSNSLFISDDWGLNWIPFNSGLTSWNINYAATSVIQKSSSGTIYAFDKSGMYSLNNASWHLEKTLTASLSAGGIVIGDKIITSDGLKTEICKESNMQWVDIGQGLPNLLTVNSMVTYFIADNVYLYGWSSNGKLYRRHLSDFNNL